MQLDKGGLLYLFFRFRLMANSSSKINLCLQVPEEEPTDRSISRWLGEPIKTVRPYLGVCVGSNFSCAGERSHLNVPDQQERLSCSLPPTPGPNKVSDPMFVMTHNV